MEFPKGVLSETLILNLSVRVSPRGLGKVMERAKESAKARITPMEPAVLKVSRLDPPALM